jgi:hypothetical protein
MANWTPDGPVGRFFRLLASYASETPDGPPPTAWGDTRHVAELLGDGATGSPRTMQIRFDGPPEDLVAHYKRWFGPVIATYVDLDAARAAKLDEELCAFLAGEDHGPPGGPPRYELEYLLVVARRALSSTGAPAAARRAAPV